jgi:anti-sigma factor RsiW
MNCFEWQNHASDYLDGLLPPEEKLEADKHLAECPSCGERHQHYRLILTAIAGQPRATLPQPLKKSPLAAVLPKLDLRHAGKSRWEGIPWHLRTLLEGTVIVALILGGIATGPRLKYLYDRHAEANLNDFTDSLSSIDLGDAATDETGAPLARGKTASEMDPPSATRSAADDYAGGEGGDTASPMAGAALDDDDSSDSEEVTVSDDDGATVGSSEIWRFNLKLDSPYEMRPKIVKTLTDLGLPPSTVGLGGIEAPGGIQFDLLVPQHSVTTLKKQLQKLAPINASTANTAPPRPHFLVQENFTWYKNKSKKPIPHGKTRVVIWLSQM